MRITSQVKQIALAAVGVALLAQAADALASDTRQESSATCLPTNKNWLRMATRSSSGPLRRLRISNPARRSIQKTRTS
jgi:hypothetical protein